MFDNDLEKIKSETFRKRLEEMMIKKDLTRQELVSESKKKCGEGFEIDTLNKWCSSKYEKLPAGDNLIRLSKLLDCDTDYLLGLQEAPKKDISLLAESTGFSWEEAERLKNIKWKAHSLLSVLLRRDDNSLEDFLMNICKQAEYTRADKSLRDYERNRDPRSPKINSIEDLSRQEYHKMMSYLEENIRPYLREFLDAVLDEYLQMNDIEKGTDIYLHHDK